MNATTGYYSIIRFCPDAARREVANVGVVLLCPEIGFLQTRMAKGTHRIKEVFPNFKEDRRRLRTTLESIAARLQVDRDHFRTVEALRRFAETRANAMRLTLPLPTRVEDPEAELNTLFTRLVGEGEKRKARKTMEARLSTAFERAGVGHLVRRSLRLELPRFPRPIKAPFGFHNGRFNVIQPARFVCRPVTGILSLTGWLEIEADLLFESQDLRLGALQLIVVAKFGSRQENLVDFVQGRLGQSHARLVRLEHLDDLIQEIRTTARPIDATMLDS